MQHGESEYNQIGRLGGDSPLSENGLNYADKLKEYFKVCNLKTDVFAIIYSFCYLKLF